MYELRWYRDYFVLILRAFFIERGDIMNIEEIKKNYLEILKKIEMESIYDFNIANAETAKNIVVNSNLFNPEVEQLAYVYELVNKIDMEILIDKKQLKRILGSTVYDSTIRNMLFYYDKPDYKEFLNETEQSVIHIHKDIEILNKIKFEEKSIKIQNTDTISEELLEQIVANKTVDEENSKNDLERIICVLSHIYEIHNKYVVYMIEEANYIDNIIKQINTIESNKTNINKIYAAIKKHAMERL
jgi:hypothetical protein